MTRMTKKEEHEYVVREERDALSHVDDHDHVQVVERESGPALERETITAETPSSEHRQQMVRNVRQERWQAYGLGTQLIWLLTGLLEFLLATRIILKLLAANPNAGFAQFIYTVTEPFLLPFHGLLGQPAIDGSVFEFSTLVAMVVYAFVGWLLTRLLRLFLGTERTTTVRTYDREAL